MKLRRLIALAIVVFMLWLTRALWLTAVGSFLVADEPAHNADAILVLAGDMDGLRVFKGGDLAKTGFAPKVYVSGPRPVYGVSEAELAIHDAVLHGFDAKLFEAIDVPSDSTEAEAAGIAPVLRARGVKTLLVVTSNYHTARAGRIWRRLAGDMQITMIAAPDTSFRADGWWKSRNGRKTAFLEWVKTLTGPLGA